jgi:hypothetical protein
VKKGRDKEWLDYYDRVKILDELLEQPVKKQGTLVLKQHASGGANGEIGSGFEPLY